MFPNECSDGGKNLSKAMEGLNTFLTDHKGLAGVILTAIQSEPEESAFPTYSENFKKYVDMLRKKFPELIIGLDIFGGILMNQYMDPKFTWLNISVIDYAIDFYAVTTEYFNLCTADFRNTGIAPLNGSNTNHTLDKLKDVLQQACIPTEKTYFTFILNPDTPDDTLTMCDVNNEKVCTQPQVACDWCVGTLLSYNEKGQFAHTNGAGFIARYIDFDDPNNCCNCEKPFPTFNAILDGFNGVSTKPCDLFDLP
ncbi:uncharacterized protein LOC132927102 [Rhopalosiphum padi]|uniref:uncharacterized protein LOC132927102 n=1 Tax=Rhopalosiphum padi TaxID=40932 RepID=UPI00298E035E|nr:uncharacterized protein LOC132927102 [Rhopalosiphum padi]